MWKDIIALFRRAGPCQEAFDETLVMLKTSHGMFHDAVASLHKKGHLIDDIYERDRQLNKYERSVRRKIVTHFSVSSRPDVNMGLVLTAIVVDMERVGDYAKNISELAVGLDEPFNAMELDDHVREYEGIVDGMFGDLVLALEGSDEETARTIMDRYKYLSDSVEEDLQLLREGKLLTGNSGQAVLTALYLRYLKRMAAHLKNVATSVVNPYHRIGFREKGKRGEKRSEDVDSHEG
jgi:phosphate transport system protein